jgi:parallel beta-helix repeat protein
LISSVSETDLDKELVSLPETPPTSASPVLVQGNSFGSDASGVIEKDNWIGAVVGGTISDATISDNTIAHNRAGGLWLAGHEATGIKLTNNRIFDNYAFDSPLVGVKGLGVDLIRSGAEGATPAAFFGPQAIDDLDADTLGANGLQNEPELSTATSEGGDVRVTGQLRSKASTQYTLEFFANRRCNIFQGEGEQPIATGLPVQVATNGSGVAQIDQLLTLPGGQTWKAITANATGPEGTSEFSKCLKFP